MLAILYKNPLECCQSWRKNRENENKRERGEGNKNKKVGIIIIIREEKIIVRGKS